MIAPSLAKLPNALDAEYWLNRIKVQEDLGNYQVNVNCLLWILVELMRHGMFFDSQKCLNLPLLHTNRCVGPSD